MGSKALHDFLAENLQDLKSKGLYNVINVLKSSNGPVITIGDKKLINLSSNNYLGLATNPRMIEATIEATKKYGSGAGAVRTINGTLEIHIELRRNLLNLNIQKQLLLSSQDSTAIWERFQQ